ncbi:outer membrane beta-barrel protein [Pedobacter faecalis]|uniref:outer membrane beta-barrel protein n=1 Tax=Pedobacter faecalis TaxID=3041495 RepID=UPI00254BCFC7|nr:outer membrane beta-barrel protein [Pedobacter sp. ELA7]
MGLFQRIILFLVVFTGISHYAKAQTFTVKGIVVDTAGLPLPGAVVRVKWAADSVAMSASGDGKFNFNNVKARQFTLSAAFIGFKNFTKEYIIEKGNTITLAPVMLQPSSNTLDAVVISGAPPVRVTEDTVSYNAAHFPVREGDAVDEVLRKLPGIKVDQDGNVTNQGEPVTKIRVNGKDYFGTDVATAIKNLPADIIKNLQFIDDYGDQAKLTGIKTGEPQKILNLTIDPDKDKGYFARVSGGLGSEDRYNTNIRANMKNKDRMTSLHGTFNNANMRGGGGDGINTRNAFGANYQNQWNEKISGNASYNFNNNRNNTISSALTQNFLRNAEGEDYIRLEDSRNNSLSRNFNHELEGELEYKIDTMNYLKVSPRIAYNGNEGTSNGGSEITQPGLRTDRNSENFNEGNNLNARTNVFYNHKFQKKGRNFSFWGSFNYSNGDNSRDVLNDYLTERPNLPDSARLQHQLIGNANDNLGLNAGGSYMEPIWEKTFVELSYNWNRSATSSSRDTRDVINGDEIFNANLSNDYEYQFITNRIGLNYRFIDQKLNYTLGVNVQPAVLTGQNLSQNIDTRKETFNVIPNARFVYKFSNQESFDVNYWGRNNQPGFLQLQPITDNSNLQNTVTGNPDLKPEFIHSLNAHYKQSDWKLGYLIDARAWYNLTKDRIVTTKVLIPGTVNQVTSYTNTDGYYNMGTEYSYSKPFAERKYTLTYSGSGSLSNNVTFIDNSRNIGKNTSWRQELEFQIDIKDVMDTEFETSYSQNHTSYSLEGDAFRDREVSRLQLGVNGRNFFFKDLTIGYNFSKLINYGLENARNPLILRLYAEYRFMKNDMANLRIDGFDLFNQNTGISFESDANFTVDRRVNRLGRYFMFSFTYRVSKWGGRR